MIRALRPNGRLGRQAVAASGESECAPAGRGSAPRQVDAVRHAGIVLPAGKIDRDEARADFGGGGGESGRRRGVAAESLAAGLADAHPGLGEVHRGLRDGQRGICGGRERVGSASLARRVIDRQSCRVDNPGVGRQLALGQREQLAAPLRRVLPGALQGGVRRGHLDEGRGQCP